MDITEELEETIDLDAEYNGKTVKFKVAKASFTPSLIRNIEQVTNYPKAIAECVKEWDVTIHGEAWPLEEEALGRLPVKFLSTILDRIGESWTGEKKSESALVNGSAATAK